MTCKVCCGITTKMDYSNEEAGLDNVSTNTGSHGDEDLEVNQTIYLTTKLRSSNNRRGVHESNNGE